MGIKGIVKKAAGKAADGVSKLSSLSPEQLDKVQSQREEYLSQMPNPNDSTAEELTKRLLAASSVEIYKAYLAQLKELYVPIEREVQYGTDFDTARTLIEALEQMWNILGIKAGTGILHFNLRVESRFLSGNRNGTAFRNVLHTVFENIADCFCCPNKISRESFIRAVNNKLLITKIHRNCNRFGSSGN